MRSPPERGCRGGAPSWKFSGKRKKSKQERHRGSKPARGLLVSFSDRAQFVCGARRSTECAFFICDTYTCASIRHDHDARPPLPGPGRRCGTTNSPARCWASPSSSCSLRCIEAGEGRAPTVAPAIPLPLPPLPAKCARSAASHAAPAAAPPASSCDCCQSARRWARTRASSAFLPR